MNIEREIRDYIAKNLLFSEDGFGYSNEASFLQEGVIDSLGVMELVTFVGSKFMIQVDPHEITPDNFDSVAKLTAYVARKLTAMNSAPASPAEAQADDLQIRTRAKAAAELIEVQPLGTRTPLFFLHGDILGGGLYCFNLARQLGQDQPFYALPPLKLDGERIPSMEQIADEQLRAIRAHTPHGPYALGGFCIGAFVAFEIAQRLRAEGETVEQLLMVDPQLPAFLGGLRAVIEWTSTRRPASIDAQMARFMMGYRRWYRVCELWRASLRDKLHFLTGGRGRSSIRENGERHRAPQQTSAATGRDLTAAYPWCAAKYRPKRYDGRAALFLCDNPMMSVKSKLRSWRRLAPNATVQVLPGEHLDLVTSDAKNLAENLRAALEQAANGKPTEIAGTRGPTWREAGDIPSENATADVARHAAATMVQPS